MRGFGEKLLGGLEKSNKMLEKKNSMAPSRCFKDLFWADSKPLTLICLIWNSSLILLQTCSKCNWASDPPHRPVPALLQWCSLSHCEGCWQWYLLSGVLPNESLWAEVKPCLGQADSYEWIFLPTFKIRPGKGVFWGGAGSVSCS